MNPLLSQAERILSAAESTRATLQCVVRAAAAIAWLYAESRLRARM